MRSFSFALLGSFEAVILKLMPWAASPANFEAVAQDARLIPNRGLGPLVAGWLSVRHEDPLGRPGVGSLLQTEIRVRTFSDLMGRHLQEARLFLGPIPWS